MKALHRRGVLCQVQRRVLPDILQYVEEKRPCMKNTDHPDMQFALCEIIIMRISIRPSCLVSKGANR